MAKTYNSIPTVSTGDVYTATAHNNIVTNVNNYRVPPMCQVYRSTDLTGYTNQAAISWSAEAFDTDDMWSSGTNVTINTAGVYAVTFQGVARGSATISRGLPEIRVNSGANILTQNDFIVVGGTGIAFNAAIIESFTAGQVVTASFFFIGGSSYLIDGATPPSNESTRLTLVWLGQVS